MIAEHFLELLFRIIVHLFPRHVGKFTVYVFTLGYVHCEDELATWIGYSLLIVVPILILIGYSIFV